MTNLPERQPDDGQKPDGSPEGYKVGPGRPPLHTRFPKGKSGNPEGGRKRKREPGYDALLNKILDERLSAQLDGKTVSLNKAKAFVRGLVDRGIAGAVLEENTLIAIERPDLTPPGGSLRFVELDSEDEIPPEHRGR